MWRLTAGRRTVFAYPQHHCHKLRLMTDVWQERQPHPKLLSWRSASACTAALLLFLLACVLTGCHPVSQVFDCRAVSAIPEHNIMLAGDRSGGIKIFQWKG